MQQSNQQMLNQNLKVDQACVDLVVKFEGFASKAFWDYKGYSIGYGHLGANKGDIITQEAAMELLRNDLQVVSKQVLHAVQVSISQNQHNALVSFVYNLGIGCLVHGRVLAGINNKNINEIKSAWLQYDHAGGKVLKALKLRREAELALYLK